MGADLGTLLMVTGVVMIVISLGSSSWATSSGRLQLGPHHIHRSNSTHYRGGHPQFAQSWSEHRNCAEYLAGRALRDHPEQFSHQGVLPYVPRDGEPCLASASLLTQC